MKKINTKTTLIVLISILMLSVFFALISSIASIYINKEIQTNAASTYYIKDLSTLKSFITKVNNGEDDANAVLTADIDCGGAVLTSIGRYIDYYSGTFNGAGYKIHNFKTNFTYMCDYVPIGHVQGFFGYTNGATIKNLRLTNFTHSTTATDKSAAIGGLVGFPVNTEILCCQVDNFKIITNSPGANIYIGGIAGYAVEGGNIENCYVTAFSHSGIFSVLTDTKVFRIAGITSYADVVDQSVFNPYRCDWTLDYQTFTQDPSTKILYRAGSASFSDDYVQWGYIACSSEGVTNCYYNNGQHYFRGLSGKSNIGGKTLKNDYGKDLPWYHNTEYEVFPLLRQFITWQEWTVKASNASAATIAGITPLFLPKDMSVSIDNPTSQSIFIAGISFTVTINNSDYVFTEWTISGKTITANVEMLYGVIEVVSVNHANLNVLPQEYRVAKGTTITYNVASNKSSVTFSFVYNNTIQTIVYTASSNTFYVEDIGLSSTVVNAGSKVTITPTFVLKSYNINFG